MFSILLIDARLINVVNCNKKTQSRGIMLGWTENRWINKQTNKQTNIEIWLIRCLFNTGFSATLQKQREMAADCQLKISGPFAWGGGGLKETARNLRDMNWVCQSDSRLENSRVSYSGRPGFRCGYPDLSSLWTSSVAPSNARIVPQGRHGRLIVS
jgi:hypothetical protein